MGMRVRMVLTMRERPFPGGRLLSGPAVSSARPVERLGLRGIRALARGCRVCCVCRGISCGNRLDAVEPAQQARPCQARALALVAWRACSPTSALADSGTVVRVEPPLCARSGCGRPIPACTWSGRRRPPSARRSAGRGCAGSSACRARGRPPAAPLVLAQRHALVVVVGQPMREHRLLGDRQQASFCADTATPCGYGYASRSRSPGAPRAPRCG